MQRHVIIRGHRARPARARACAPLALSVVLGACAASPPAPPAGVPDALRVPPDSQLLSQVLHGSGVQIYECERSPKEAARFAWVFKAPAAELSDPRGKAVGKHYAGPTWEANDGSKVIGEVVASGPAPTADAIPWLLLRAKSTAGTGAFGGTTFIQRLHTLGGRAPADGCDEAHLGQGARIPYEADYYFYAPQR